MEPSGIQLAGPLGLGGPEVLFIGLLFVLLFRRQENSGISERFGGGHQNFKTCLEGREEKVEEKKQA